MKQSIQNLIQSEMSEADFPEFEPGDTIRVITREEIGGQMRTRKFEGVCIARRGEGPNKTFKVRKMSFGVGVERTFPLHSPIIEDIKLIKRGKVRRAKLTYLEGRSTRGARIKERRGEREETEPDEGTSAGDEATAVIEEPAEESASEDVEEADA